MTGWQWKACLGVLLSLILAPPLFADDASNTPKPLWTLTPAELNNLGVTAAKAGRLEEAVDHLRHAILLAPDDPTFKKNLSNMLTELALKRYNERQIDQAITLLEEAVTTAPDNGAALAHLGDLYYLERSDFDRAIGLWERAQGKLPPEQEEAVAQRLSRAQRDRAIERGYASRQTEHFQIRMQGGTDPQALRALGRVLEEEYARLAAAFGSAPASLTVIIYAGDEFRRVAGRRDWALGLYDGRIRIRADELGGPWERTVLAHELGHAFLYTAFRRPLPTWIHEGFAQAMEPARDLTPGEEEIKTALVTTRNQWIPLAWLDRRFQQPATSSDVGRAYVESRLVVEFLLRRHSMARFKQFVERVAAGEKQEAAFDAVFAPARWARVAQGLLE